MHNAEHVSMTTEELFSWFYDSCSDYGLLREAFRDYLPVLNALQCQFLCYLTYSKRNGLPVEHSERSYLAYGLRHYLEMETQATLLMK